VDVATEPRWYRIQTTFGESPKWNAEIAREIVLGFQEGLLDDVRRIDPAGKWAPNLPLCHNPQVGSVVLEESAQGISVVVSGQSDHGFDSCVLVGHGGLPL
jgi:hypothetical protein